MNDYILVGKITDTHGIKGELRIKSDFENKNVFNPNNTLYIGEDKIPEEITSYRVHKDFDMVTFKNYSNINEVLKYLKEFVYIKRSSLNLKDDEYVLSDLIGLDIVEDDIILAKVVDYINNNGQVLLQLDNNKYIPKVDEYIIKVDIKNKKIITKNVKSLFL